MGEVADNFLLLPGWLEVNFVNTTYYISERPYIHWIFVNTWTNRNVFLVTIRISMSTRFIHALHALSLPSDTH